MTRADAPLLLAADLGGTKTLLELGKDSGDGYSAVRAQRFENASFASLEAVIRCFLQDVANVDAACIAVAGPVLNGRAHVTNLPWVVDAAALSDALNGARVRLINDFEAVAYGVGHVAPEALVTLQHGRPETHGVCAVIGAGTGLGEGFVVWCGGKRIAHASEGGHTDFAPRNALQLRLLDFLNARYGHVSYERILSGPGLLNVLEFLYAEAGEAGDLVLDPAEVTAQAFERPESVAALAVALFIEVLGAEAGNLALKSMPTGGLYIAGGIAPKMLDSIVQGECMAAFRAKGRMSELMARFPVHVVRDLDVGLKGAVAVARELIAQ